MRRYTEELRGIADVWRTVLTAEPEVRGTVQLARSKTLVAVGSGCSLAVAALAASLYRSRGWNAVYCTPYQTRDFLRKGQSLIVVSASATHPDIDHVLEVGRAQQASIVVLTLNRNTDLLWQRAGSVFTVVTPMIDIKSTGFIPTRAPAALAALLLLMSECEGRPAEMSGLAARAAAEHERQARSVDWLGDIDHFHVVHDVAAQPGAIDLETRLLETGAGTVSRSDPWNFGHGRYMSLTRNQSTQCVVLLGRSSSEEDLGRVREFIPPGVPSINISVSGDSVPAGLLCWFRALWLTDSITMAKGIDPGRIRSKDWGDRLYLERGESAE